MGAGQWTCWFRWEKCGSVISVRRTLPPLWWSCTVLLPKGFPFLFTIWGPIVSFGANYFAPDFRSPAYLLYRPLPFLLWGGPSRATRQSSLPLVRDCVGTLSFWVCYQSPKSICLSPSVWSCTKFGAKVTNSIVYVYSSPFIWHQLTIINLIIRQWRGSKESDCRSISTNWPTNNSYTRNSLLN